MTVLVFYLKCIYALNSTGIFLSDIEHCGSVASSGRGLTFDGRLEGPRDGDHDVGAEDPEDVVEEQPTEQDAARDHVVEVQQLHAVDGERDAEQVVSDPVLAGAHTNLEQHIFRPQLRDVIYIAYVYIMPYSIIPCRVSRDTDNRALI